MTCKRCGCTETTPCPGGCAWMLPNLCTSCLTPEEAAIDKAYAGIIEGLREEQLYQRCALAVAQGLAANPGIDDSDPQRFASRVCELARWVSDEIALGVPEDGENQEEPSGLVLP